MRSILCLCPLPLLLLAACSSSSSTEASNSGNAALSLGPASAVQPDGKVSPTESVAAYVRDDAVDAVVHYCDGGHLCELSFSRGAAHWRLTDMNANFAGRGA